MTSEPGRPEDPDIPPGDADGDARTGDEEAGTGDEEAGGKRGVEPRDRPLRTFSVQPPQRTGVFVDAASLRAHVGDLLRTYLGGYEVDAFGNMTFMHETARIFVTVSTTPIGPQIGVFSITNLDMDFTADLAHFLLTTNHGLGFGAFSYDAENEAVWLRHTLLGTTLDAPELQTSVAAIASTAAHFDAIIKQRFGGRTFNEASPEAQEAAHPPPPMASGYL